MRSSRHISLRPHGITSFRFDLPKMLVAYRDGLAYLMGLVHFAFDLDLPKMLIA